MFRFLLILVCNADVRPTPTSMSDTRRRKRAPNAPVSTEDVSIIITKGLFLEKSLQHREILGLSSPFSPSYLRRYVAPCLGGSHVEKRKVHFLLGHSS